MRILVWTQYFWPEVFHINEVASALAEEGHDVTVLTGKPNYPSGMLFPGYTAIGITEEQMGKVTVRRVPLLPRGKSAVRLALNYLSFILSGYALAGRALKGRAFDVILVYAPSPILQALPALALARRKRVPLALWVQDLWPDALEATGFVRNRHVLRLTEQVVRQIYARSDIVLAQSEAFRDRIILQSGDADKVFFLPNSFDPRNLESEGSSIAKQLAQAMRGFFSVTFTGNIGHAQSMETLLAAAQELADVPDVRFFVFGDGSRLNWLREEVSRMGLSNVVLAGSLPRGDMPTVMQASSALLLTLGSGGVGSYTIPSKLQAYLAMGKPIIASADGEAARVVVESESGIVCRAGNSSDLAAAILHLRRMSPDEHARLGARGRAYFGAHFSLSGTMKRLAILLEESLRRSGS